MSSDGGWASWGGLGFLPKARLSARPGSLRAGSGHRSSASEFIHSVSRTRLLVALGLGSPTGRGTGPRPPPQPAAAHRAPRGPRSATSPHAASGSTPPAFRRGRARSGQCGRRRLLLVKGSWDQMGSTWVISLWPPNVTQSRVPRSQWRGRTRTGVMGGHVRMPPSAGHHAVQTRGKEGT